MEAYRVDRFYSDNAVPRRRLLQIAQATGTAAIDPVHIRPFYVRSMVRYLDPALNGSGRVMAKR